MSSIQINNKKFEPYISHAEIQQGIEQLAVRINEELATENPLFICVLNGAFIFFADLFREISVPCEVGFIRFKSYVGMKSTKQKEVIIDPSLQIEGRTIVIVEDIIDTGHTIKMLLKAFQSHHPKQIKICTLFLKREMLQVEIPLDYTVKEIDKPFIVGYGLDYNEQGRNLKDIYQHILQ